MKGMKATDAAVPSLPKRGSVKQGVRGDPAAGKKKGKKGDVHKMTSGIEAVAARGRAVRAPAERHVDRPLTDAEVRELVDRSLLFPLDIITSILLPV